MERLFLILIVFAANVYADDKLNFNTTLSKEMLKRGRADAERVFGREFYVNACKLVITQLNRERLDHLGPCLNAHLAEADALIQNLAHSNYLMFQKVRNYASIAGIDKRVMDRAIQSNKRGTSIENSYMYFLFDEINRGNKIGVVIMEETLSVVGCKKKEVERVYYDNCDEFLFKGTDIPNY